MVPILGKQMEVDLYEVNLVSMVSSRPHVTTETPYLKKTKKRGEDVRDQA